MTGDEAILILHCIAGEADKAEKNDKGTSSDKIKKKEKQAISRYGSFYLRLGAIGKIV